MQIPRHLQEPIQKCADKLGVKPKDLLNTWLREKIYSVDPNLLVTIPRITQQEPKKEPVAKYQNAVYPTSVWCKKYTQRYNRPYSWQGKDTASLERLLAWANSEGMTLDEIFDSWERYFDDEDQFLVQVAHSFGVYCSRVNQYLGPKDQLDWKGGDPYAQ